MINKPADLITIQTFLLTTAAVIAFAANSLLCRLALQQPAIDPFSFSSIRLVSGAITLGILVRLRSSRQPAGPTDWFAAAMLFAYVALFSCAYLGLSAGTGALILFGAVQLTMLGGGLWAGERFSRLAWAGLILAASGLVYLVSPGIAAPRLPSATSMAAAGAAWGIYSLRGRRVADPLAATAANFMRAVPFALALSVLFASDAHAQISGVALAAVSGAVTSGVGYVIWYAALRRLSAMRAATVQLSVPLVAAVGGVVFLSEAITPRLVTASAAILGGIALALAGKAVKQRAN